MKHLSNPQQFPPLVFAGPAGTDKYLAAEAVLQERVGPVKLLAQRELMGVPAVFKLHEPETFRAFALLASIGHHVIGVYTGSEEGLRAQFESAGVNPPSGLEVRYVDDSRRRAA